MKEAIQDTDVLVKRKWVLSMHFKRMARSHLNDWISIYFKTLFDCHPWFLFMGIYTFYPIKTKTWPHADCQRESVSAKLRKKPHLFWGTRGLCFAGERKGWLCVMNATMKIRAEVVASLVQAFSSSTVSHSRENKRKWYNNTREGGSE